MPTPPVWTLTASGIFPPGSEGTKLAGCHIIENAANYTFTKPDWTVLSSSTGSSLPTPSFTFPVFTYKGLQWTITVISLSVDGDLRGTWSAGAESGDFTAPVGTALSEDEASSSAKA